MGQFDSRSLEKTLGEMIARASNPAKPMREIGALMVSEMQENFRVQGRPETWEQSERAKKTGGQTLRDTGTLMRGIIFEINDTSVAAGPTMVGKEHITDPRVMKLLAFGGDVKRSRKSRETVKRKGATLGTGISHYPKRDFTYIPAESNKTFGQILQDYLVR